MNDNEITTIAEGCDPERCTDRVGGEHAETCRVAVSVEITSRGQRLIERQAEEQETDPRWQTSRWTDG